MAKTQLSASLCVVLSAAALSLSCGAGRGRTARPSLRADRRRPVRRRRSTSSVDGSATAVGPACRACRCLIRRRASASIAALKSGLDALAADDLSTARARSRRRCPPIALDRHILTWAIAMRAANHVSSGEIADGAQELLPDWPGTDALRKNSERALYRENPPPQTVVQAFGGSQPQTIEGVMILARSHAGAGPA